MRREQLEHLIRATGDVLSERVVIVGGSEAILGSYDEDELPPAATLSVEADFLPLDDPDQRKADRIDGLLGEGSQFHATHAIYADGIDAKTMTLPRWWRKRLVSYETPNTN